MQGNKEELQGDLLEGGVAWVAFPGHVFILAPVLGHKVCQLVRCFAHLWVHGLLHSRSCWPCRRQLRFHVSRKLGNRSKHNILCCMPSNSMPAS